MGFVFGKTSRKRLVGVHPDLKRCAVLALKYGVIDFSIAQGVRTLEEQKVLYSQGRDKPGKVVTWTLKSKHIIDINTGFGHAIDIVPFVNGRVDWGNRQNFVMIATLMFKAAMEIDVKIKWGGHWKRQDMPHFELLKG